MSCDFSLDHVCLFITSIIFQILFLWEPVIWVEARCSYFWHSSLAEFVPLTLFFPMFPFGPPENIRKPLVFRAFTTHVLPKENIKEEKKLLYLSFEVPNVQKRSFYIYHLKCQTKERERTDSFQRVFLLNKDWDLFLWCCYFLAII